MDVHANAKLGPAGRFALAEAIASGTTQKAAAFCVSPATAHRWWHRRLGASQADLVSGAWLSHERPPTDWRLRVTRPNRQAPS